LLGSVLVETVCLLGKLENWATGRGMWCCAPESDGVQILNTEMLASVEIRCLKLPQTREIHATASPSPVALDPLGSEVTA
jgi:hypothetical protein